MKNKDIKIVFFADSHGHHEDLEIPQCDILIFGGDMSMIGEKHEIERFFSWLKKQRQCRSQVIIPGNHDLCFDPYRGKNKGRVQDWVIDIIGDYSEKGEGRYHFLINNSCEVDGLKIWGSPVTPWFFGETWAFNKHRGKEIEEVWNEIPKDTDIVVSHGPCQSVLDKLEDGQKVGCEDLYNRIAVIKPSLFLCGHIHCANGYEFVDSTYHVNGAVLSEQYYLTHSPYIINVAEEKRSLEIERI